MRVRICRFFFFPFLQPRSCWGDSIRRQMPPPLGARTTCKRGSKKLLRKYYRTVHTGSTDAYFQAFQQSFAGNLIFSSIGAGIGPVGLKKINIKSNQLIAVAHRSRGGGGKIHRLIRTAWIPHSLTILFQIIYISHILILRPYSEAKNVSSDTGHGVI